MIESLEIYTNSTDISDGTGFNTIAALILLTIGIRHNSMHVNKSKLVPKLEI